MDITVISQEQNIDFFHLFCHNICEFLYYLFCITFFTSLSSLNDIFPMNYVTHHDQNWKECTQRVQISAKAATLPTTYVPQQ